MRCRIWPSECNKQPGKAKNKPRTLPIIRRRPCSRTAGPAAFLAHAKRWRPIDAARFYFAVFCQIIFLLQGLYRRFFGRAMYRLFLGIGVAAKKGADL